MATPKPINFPLSEVDLQKFHSFVDRKDSNQCWNWTGKINRGYGALYIQSLKREARASRLAYKIYLGVDPGDLLVCHTCDNPACCNPKHLFLGTFQDNMTDKANKGRLYTPGPTFSSTGEAHPKAKLTKQQVLEIRSKYKPREYSLNMLAYEYGVSKKSILQILQNKVWVGRALE